MKKRIAKVSRKTGETDISIELNIDGKGLLKGKTPIGFLNHMFSLFAKQSMFDITIKATGDQECDDHHLIEDIGITLGEVIKKALGEKRGITRYGSQILPMDDVLVLCAVDLGGRFSFFTDYSPVREKVNDFSTEMVRHFFESIAINAMMNLYIQYLNPGCNEHHRIEAAFKAFGRAMRYACENDSRLNNNIPSTKEVL